MSAAKRALEDDKFDSFFVRVPAPLTKRIRKALAAQRETMPKLSVSDFACHLIALGLGAHERKAE